MFSENDATVPQDIPWDQSRSASEPSLMNSLLSPLYMPQSKSISRQRSGILNDQANSDEAIREASTEESSSGPQREISDLSGILADARFMGATLSSENEWRNSMESASTSRPSPSPRTLPSLRLGSSQSQQASQYGIPRATDMEPRTTDGNDSDDDRLAQMYYTSTYGEDDDLARSHSAPTRFNG